MNFFQRAKCLFSNSAFSELKREWLSGNSDILSDNTQGGIDDIALKYTAVYACTRVLAETFAYVPIAEFQENENGDRDRTNATGWLDTLKNVANPEMSSFSMKEMSMYQINLGGNAVCERLKSANGRPAGLYPYKWQNVEITRDKTTKEIIYKVNDPDTTGEPRILKRDQVLHIAGNTLDGITGMSPISYAAGAIRLGKTYEKFTNSFYKNGAMPTGVFKHQKFLKDESFDRLAKEIAENWAGLTNAGKPMLLEDGLDFDQVHFKPIDAELLSSKKFQVEDICRIYRVPLHLVQNLDKATNNNIEHQSLEFVMYTMLPWFKRWESAINSQLLTAQQRNAGYYFEYNVASLLRGDSKSMAEAFAAGRQWGWLSVNDIRRLLNMNKIPNGDVYLQPINMAEAGDMPPIGNENMVNDIRALIEKSRG